MTNAIKKSNSLRLFVEKLYGRVSKISITHTANVRSLTNTKGHAEDAVRFANESEQVGSFPDYRLYGTTLCT